MSKLGLRIPTQLIFLLGFLSADVWARDAGDAMPKYTNSTSLREDASLAAVDFADSNLGLACGDHGAIWRSTDGGLSWTLIDSGVSCRFEDVFWIDSRNVLIVGGSYDPVTQISRGVVLRSSDGGESWQRGDDEELPKLRQLQLTQEGSIVASGDWSHSLLTNRLATGNRGLTWDDAIPRKSVDLPYSRTRFEQWAAATGVAAPVRDVCRLNDQKYCAVGDHGIIQISADGGKTWRTTRGAERQTCVMFVAREPATVAWSLVGNEALENRNRSTLVLTESSGDLIELDVARQVMAMFGGASVDPFRDAASESNDLEAVVRGWLRVHRPLVLVIDDGVEPTLKDTLLRLATTAGVRRVVHYVADGGGNMTLHRDAMLTRTGVLASDLQVDGMHLVAADRATAESLSLKFVYDVAADNRRADSLTAALAVKSGHRLQAAAPTASRRNLQMAQARIQQLKRVTDFVSRSTTAEQYRVALKGILDQTASDDQFRVAWSVLLIALDRGVRRDKVIETLNEIAERFADRSLGQWAALRSESLKYSREWTQIGLPNRESGLRSAATPAPVPVSPFQESFNGVRQASAVVPLLVPDQTPERPAKKETSQPAEVDLNWEFHPLVLLARDASRRRGDDDTLQPAEEVSADLARLSGGSQNDWSQLIFSPARGFSAHPTPEPPHLDGVLDDACWQTALGRAGKRPQLRLAYDESYLYAAIVIDADRLREDQEQRLGNLRDQDLSGVDRVRIRFDIDRDLTTSMQLQVSAAGRTHDAIDGNPAWQPTWYVDTRRHDDKVIIELALSRHDIADLPITANEVWFTSIEVLPAGFVPREVVIPDPQEWERVVFRP